jgi:polyisoprenoid-binding protein YceI
VPPGLWTVDPVRSRIGFTARHLLVAKIRGRFLGVAGTIDVGRRPEDSSVLASAEAATITTGDPDRDEHLRSAEFLDAARWPLLTITGAGLRRAGDRYLLDADLTIRDVTRTVEMTIIVRGSGDGPPPGHLALTGTARVDRREFGLLWNPAIETAGVLVGDLVDLRLDVVAVRADDLPD